MLSFDYTKRHNQILRCIHLLMCLRYGLKSSKKIRNHSVQEIVCNEDVEIRVDNRIKTNVNIQCNKPDLFIHDKRKNLITLIEVGITRQDNLKTVETEKLRKYDLLANELSLIYKCKVEIIPFVLTWDGVITKYHSLYAKKLSIPSNYKHTSKL
ncbi:hypothetical protein NUSPORA_00589 [Nucleospora cyclopteri]